MTLRTPEERRQMLPIALTSEIAAFYCAGRSIDPSKKISYARNLTGSMGIGIKITGEDELLPRIKKCEEWCVQGLKLYSDGNWTKSNFAAELVLDDLGELCHLGYANLNEDSFSLPPAQDNNEVQK